MNIARFTSRPAQLPTAQEARLAADSARLLATSFGDGEIVTLRVNDTDPGIALPSSALRMLVAILAQMGRGHAVTVVSLPPELTAAQAADVLDVSQAALVLLLEAGDIPFHTVGSARRVMLKDLLEYRSRLQSQRAAASDALARDAQELGMGYGRPRTPLGELPSRDDSDG